jgi:WD40 repeat protein
MITSYEVPQIPAIVWVEHVLTFLDRSSRNNVCATNKELYEKRLLMDARWPYRSNYVVDSYVSSLAFSSDGKLLAIGDANDGTIQLLSCVDGKRTTFRRQRQNLGISCLSFSRDNKFLASVRWDGRTIRLWNVEEPEKDCWILEGHTDTVWLVVCSPVDSSVLASAGRDGTVRLWRDDGSCMLILRDDDLHCQVNSVAFSPDGSTLAAVIETPDYGGRLLFWDDLGYDVEDQNKKCASTKTVFHNHTGRCTSILFSPNGQVFATGSWDDSVKLWNAASHTCFDVLPLQDEVHSIAFSPNGKLLVAGCCDRSMHFWNVESADTSAVPLLVLSQHHSTTWCSIRFCRDGTLASSGGTGRDCIRLWNPIENDWKEEELVRGQDDYQQLIELWG